MELISKSARATERSPGVEQVDNDEPLNEEKQIQIEINEI